MENTVNEVHGKNVRSFEDTTRSRRVSISDQVIGIDNPVFEHHRRISASSDHNSDCQKKKSILHHGSNENIQHKLDLDNGHTNSQNRKKSAMSLSSSIRDKIEYTEELKRYGTDFFFFKYI